MEGSEDEDWQRTKQIISCLKRKQAELHPTSRQSYRYDDTCLKRSKKDESVGDYKTKKKSKAKAKKEKSREKSYSTLQALVGISNNELTPADDKSVSCAGLPSLDMHQLSILLCHLFSINRQNIGKMCPQKHNCGLDQPIKTLSQEVQTNWSFPVSSEVTVPLLCKEYGSKCDQTLRAEPNPSTSCVTANAPSSTKMGNIDSVMKEISPPSSSNSDVCPSVAKEHEVSRKEVLSSHEFAGKESFEDLDISTQELLLLLRQQELIHEMRRGEPVTSSSGQRLLFRKLKADNQPLPPELQNNRIFTPRISHKGCSVLDAIEDHQVNSSKDLDKFLAPEHQLSPLKLPSKKPRLLLEKEDVHPVSIVKLKNSIFDSMENRIQSKEAVDAGQNLVPSQAVEKEGQSEGDHLFEIRKIHNLQAEADNQSTSSEDIFSDPYEGNRVAEKRTSDVSVKTSESFHIRGGKSCSEKKGVLETSLKKCSVNVNKVKDKQRESQDVITEPFTEPNETQKYSHLKEQEKVVKPRTTEDEQLMPPPKEKLKAGEVAIAHDLAVAIILNPWRGIKARQTTRSFRAPEYDKKKITQALWDLRSDCPPQDVVRKIMSEDWNINKQVLEIMISIFIYAIARASPFIIEAKVTSEDDDDKSGSEMGGKKRTTSIRFLASRPILKGEVIHGLTGVLIKINSKEEELLRKWNLLEESRGVYGPISYLLKRKYTGPKNVEVIPIKEHLIGAKALRNIYKGEKIIANFENLLHLK